MCSTVTLAWLELNYNEKQMVSIIDENIHIPMFKLGEPILSICKKKRNWFQKYGPLITSKLIKLTNLLNSPSQRTLFVHHHTSPADGPSICRDRTRAKDDRGNFWLYETQNVLCFVSIPELAFTSSKQPQEFETRSRSSLCWYCRNCWRPQSSRETSCRNRWQEIWNLQALQHNFKTTNILTTFVPSFRFWFRLFTWSWKNLTSYFVAALKYTKFCFPQTESLNCVAGR